jgi:hypothetical protein
VPQRGHDVDELLLPRQSQRIALGGIVEGDPRDSPHRAPVLDAQGDQRILINRASG